ncbi:hypothetical protein [Nonomuraea recticatena]|uniref:Uncharacterized protein n=1 Tax=Nonomuraea recticatena TaxID=46178 RepID=A0ABN3S0R3_9ACTN
MSDVNAVKADVERPDSVKVPFRDIEFVVKTDPMEWAFDTMENLGDNKYASGLAGMLGPVQYSRFKSMNPSMKEALALLEAISSNVGAGDAGN